VGDAINTAQRWVAKAVTGTLTMRNLDITDPRAKLQVYSNAGLPELGKGDDFLKLGK